MLIYILLAAALSFVGTKLFIRYCEKNDLLGVDQHKPWRYLPLTGGLPVLLAVLITISVYLGNYFFSSATVSFSYVFYLVLSSLSLSIITFIGLLDDFSKKKGGLNKWHKPVLSILAITPFIFLPILKETIEIPLVGVLSLSYISSMIITLVVFVGATNMVNMLAGMNGLEAGLGIIYTSMLGLYAIRVSNGVVAVLSLVLLGALFGFYWFNKYPSKIFPGDSLTYLLGTYIGIVATIGGMEKQAFFVSIPFFIEGVLKVRGRFQEQSFCKVAPNKKLMHKGKIFSLTHVVAKTNLFTERQAVFVLYFFEFACSLLIWVV